MRSTGGLAGAGLGDYYGDVVLLDGVEDLAL
jgi:hypothetical protein